MLATAAVSSTASMADASRPLCVALARAGALGAAARLAQHWVGACEEPQLLGKAQAALRCVQPLLQAVSRQLPKARARCALPVLSAHAGASWSADAARAARQDCSLMADVAPPLGGQPVEDALADVEGILAEVAVEFEKFEAADAQRLPADTLSPFSLEDLRLRTPALRPVGCWWSGCAPLSRPRRPRRP